MRNIPAVKNKSKLKKVFNSMHTVTRLLVNGIFCNYTVTIFYAKCVTRGKHSRCSITGFTICARG